MRKDTALIILVGIFLVVMIIADVRFVFNPTEMSHGSAILFVLANWGLGGFLSIVWENMS